jgi:hypothetical protein
MFQKREQLDLTTVTLRIRRIPFGVRQVPSQLSQRFLVPDISLGQRPMDDQVGVTPDG